MRIAIIGCSDETKRAGHIERLEAAGHTVCLAEVSDEIRGEEFDAVWIDEAPGPIDVRVGPGHREMLGAAIAVTLEKADNYPKDIRDHLPQRPTKAQWRKQMKARL